MIINFPRASDSSFDGRQLYDLFLRFNRRLIGILMELSPALSINESHALADICEHPRITAKELCTSLTLSKSTVSRILSSLVKRDFMRYSRSSEDGRSKPLEITPEGDFVLAQDSSLRNRETEICVKPLTSSEQEELRYFLQWMADTLNAAKVNPRADDNPVKKEIRRLTRAMGFMREDCMGTRNPPDRCQVLHLLLQAGGALEMSQLSLQLPYETSILSRLVSSLEDEGLLKKEFHPGDRRKITVSLMAQGRKLGENLEKLGTTFLLQSLKGLESNQIERFIEVLKKFLLTPELLTPAHGFRFAELKSLQQMKEARRFVVERLVEERRHFDLEETLLPKSSVVYAISQDGELKGVAELRMGEKSVDLYQLIVARERNVDRIVERLLGHLRQFVRETFSQQKISMSRNAFGAELIESMPAVKASKHSLVIDCA